LIFITSPKIDKNIATNGWWYEKCCLAGFRPYPLWQKHNSGRNDLKATEAAMFYDRLLAG